MMDVNDAGMTGSAHSKLHVQSSPVHRLNGAFHSIIVFFLIL